MFNADSEQKGTGMRKSWVWVAVGALLTASAVRAQEVKTGKLNLAVVGGLSAASGASADQWKASYSVGGEVDFALAPEWALTLAGAYNEALPKYSTSTDKAKVIELGANVKYVISASSAARPYIRFGGGLYNRDMGSGTTENNFGLSGGAGVDFYLPDSPLGFTLAARFHRVFITSTSVQTGDWEYFNFWGGVRFRVG
jgi:outer membrane protein W